MGIIAEWSQGIKYISRDRPYISARLFLLFLVVAVPISLAENYADFIVVENPEELRLLNKYEQVLSASERKRLQDFSPFRIKELRMMLGDGITEVTSVEYYNEPYFIVLKEDGSFLGNERAGTIKTLKRCTLISDTIVVTAQNTIKIANKYGGSPDHHLKAGEQWIRLFSYNGTYCLFRDNKRPSFGWSRLHPRSAWSELDEKQADVADTIDSEIVGRIGMLLDSANDAYSIYIDYMNQRTGKAIHVPKWECRKSENGLICEAENGKILHQLAQSNRHLVHSIENLLYSTPYTAYLRSGKIIISQRKKRIK